MIHLMRSARRTAIGSTAILGLLFPSGLTGQTSELILEVWDALEKVCVMVDLSSTVSRQVAGIANSINGIPSGLSNPTPNQIGAVAEESAEDVLREGGFNDSNIARQEPFIGSSGRNRRADFIVSRSNDAVNLEVKNKLRITTRDLRQVRDYAGSRRHTFLLVRNGTKVSRSIAAAINALSRSGLVTVLECAFAF